MPQLDTPFARGKQMVLRVIRSLADSPGEDWSSLSPAAICLLTPATPSRLDTVRPRHARQRD
ncbi:hypothetical protein SAMN05216588_13330 [Pseudomonas flavescens]|uniref:Uncharacterized protein n=1 Tax=Phytopseudomonas flavescens TaxID=29435 RepID=A0A1G8Q7W7_9GAMM|nr:hypothetical protein [Pseudomonas flavescens]SDJ00663.1 hypothetical protein SAMN05216588_13330 [Pseudomonas flavescens]